MKFLKSIIFITTIVGCQTSFAQDFNSSYFVEGSLYRHQANPALADSMSYASIPGVGSLHVKSLGNFGIRDVIRDNPLYPNKSDKRKTTFLNPYLNNQLEGFKELNRFGVFADINLLSVGFKAMGGNNNISIRAKAMAYGRIPKTLLEMAVNTGNEHYDIDDVNAMGRAYTELAWGHARKINDKWRVGAKFKLLFGIANATADVSGLKANLTPEGTWRLNGDMQSHLSMKGAKYTSKQKDYKTASKGSYEYVDGVDVNGSGIGGLGMSIDLGGEYAINQDWKVSAALLDLGFIHWSNDIYATNREKEFIFEGFHDTSIQEDGNNTPKEQSHKYGDQLADFYHLNDLGNVGSRTTGVGATLNMGVEYKLPTYRNLKFGLLSSTHFQEPFTWTEARLCANIAPLKWLDGGVNFAVNTFTTSAGWILNIHPRGFSFYVGMDHLIGKTTKEWIPLSSNASFAMGMNITW